MKFMKVIIIVKKFNLKLIKERGTLYISLISWVI